MKGTVKCNLNSTVGNTALQGLCGRLGGPAAVRLCDGDQGSSEAGPPSPALAALADQIFQYSRDNLAMVNVYIKNPVVTKIRYCAASSLKVL